MDLPATTERDLEALVILVAPTLTVKDLAPILKEALPGFKPLIVNFLPDLETFTIFFSAAERPEILAEEETETVTFLFTPTTLVVAASALIGAAVITKAEAKRAEIAFFDFLERKLLYIKTSINKIKKWSASPGDRVTVTGSLEPIITYAFPIGKEGKVLVMKKILALFWGISIDRL